MKYLIIILLFLTGCKSTCKVEKASSYDSLQVEKSIRIEYDSIVYKILSSLRYELEYSHVDWSTPDEQGNQYKVQETTIKGKGNEDKVEEGTKINQGINISNDSAYVSENKSGVTTPVKTLNWWDKIRIKFGNLIIIVIVVGLTYIVVWLIRRK